MQHAVLEWHLCCCCFCCCCCLKVVYVCSWCGCRRHDRTLLVSEVRGGEKVFILDSILYCYLLFQLPWRQIFLPCYWTENTICQNTQSEHFCISINRRDCLFLLLFVIVLYLLHLDLLHINLVLTSCTLTSLTLAVFSIASLTWYVVIVFKSWCLAMRGYQNW